MGKKITQKMLYNVALSYLAKYEASTGKLKDILNRRLIMAERRGIDIPAEAPAWIENVIHQMVAADYVNDTRYTENTYRHLAQAGKSLRYIKGKMALASIDFTPPDDVPTDALDLAAALIFVKKKKLGIYRPAAVRSDYAQKDLAALGRAGFSYEISKKALNGADDD